METEKEPELEELFEQLEEVIGKMEEKDTSLEESFAAVSETEWSLLKTCKAKQLTGVEKKGTDPGREWRDT